MKRGLATAALILALPVHAEVVPQPGPGDPHIQSVVYDPDQVVRIQTAPGYALTVEFSPGERIENVAVGDGSAWQVSANKRGDLLFIKQSLSAPETNLTVVTDTRRYAFTLVPGYGPDPRLPYTLRFTYPALASAPIMSVAQVRTSYKLSGAKPLWPTAVYDDGASTYIRWRPAQDLPAVYAIGADGHETIVNGAMRDGIYVIDTVAPRIVLRLGKTKAIATRRKAKRES